MFATLLTDLRYALRGLTGKPLFALVAIASLALGIGANTAIFSLFQQVVLKPLAVAEPGRLVNLSAPGIKTGSTSSGSTGPREDIISYPMLRDLQAQHPPQLTGIAGHRALQATLGWQGSTRHGAAVDPDLPVEDLRTLPQQIERTLVMERFVGLLSTAFALVSTLLAALGLYGVLAYTLSQRTREIGLRLALGAAPRRLGAMLLGQVARMTLAGGLLGLGLALVAGRAAQSLLFGLDGHDPRVLIAASTLLALVALGTGLLPARRASRIDPMVALRHE